MASQGKKSSPRRWILPIVAVALLHDRQTQFVSVDHSQPLLNVGGTASWTIPIPLDSSLSGLEFFSQGVVLFGFQAAVSNATRGVLGGLR